MATSTDHAEQAYKIEWQYEQARQAIDLAGWLLREPLDFGSTTDQNNIRKARSQVATAYKHMMIAQKLSTTTPKEGQ